MDFCLGTCTEREASFIMEGGYTSNINTFSLCPTSKLPGYLGSPGKCTTKPEISLVTYSKVPITNLI